MGEFFGDELHSTQIPISFYSNNMEYVRDRFSMMGSDWQGPKYKISLRARRDMELEKSSYNKNNPRMVELSRFPTHPLPAPLPSGLRISLIVSIVLKAQKDLIKKKKFYKKLEIILNSKTCEEILKNVFWWFYLKLFKDGKLQQQAELLYQNAANSFAELVMDQLCEATLISSSDTFMLRYSSLLAQLVYVTFCWAYPQSHPKFSESFRETILQTCSRWICGIRLRPNLHIYWDLRMLEPPAFRNRNAKRTDENDNQMDPWTALTNNVAGQHSSVTFRKNVNTMKHVHRFIRKTEGQIESRNDTSGLYKFKKKKFNIAGLSPFLESYLVADGRFKDGFVCSWQPLINRTEISGCVEKKSLLSTLEESKCIVRESARKINDCIKKEYEYRKRFKTENDMKKSEMLDQINHIMKSKSQIHQYCDLCMISTSARNPVPTQKILRIMNSNKLYG